MHNDFERIKNNLDLLGVINRETELVMKGPHLESCPFCGGHDCFSIFNNSRQYKCHQCSENGDVFTFLQHERIKGLSPAESLKYAAKLAGIELTPSNIRSDPKLTTKELIFIQAAAYYHGHMLDNGGKVYLIEQRGHKEDVLRKMQVGWTDGGLTEYLRTSGYKDEEIKKSGLVKEIQDNGAVHLVDFFVKDLAIFPHFEKDRVLHFTIKHPRKKLTYQLPAKERIKDWTFYNQDTLSKYGEVIVVEGENDLLSILDTDTNNVISLIGQPAEYQTKALQSYCSKKHLYLWMDNDQGGKNFIRKICTSIHGNIRIISHPSGPEGGLDYKKDPDEYLHKFEGDRRKEIKRLQDEALDYISWEILEISRLATLEERLKTLKEQRIFTAIADMVEAEKLVYIEKLAALGFSRTAIEEQVEINHDLRNQFAIYFERVPKKDADPNYIASLVFRSLSESGRCYRDRVGDCYILYHHLVYIVGNNRPFNALMKKLTGLLPTKEPGRSVWESLASEVYNSGTQIDLASWIHTDRTTDTIYINLNSPNSIILKVSRDDIEEIQNGMNKESVLLKSSKKIMPMNYHPDVDMREGMSALKELIFDNLACEKEQRYLILCWLVSAFMLDFCPYMGLMKFSGASAAGKTTAARLLSLLIYGNEQLGDPTAASAYAVASQNPLLVIDNMESDDFTKSLLKFLLLSATKGGKEKRTQGTDSDTIQEQPKALVCVTAIEPFIKSELINRTYDIDFTSKFKNDYFVEDEVIRAIIKKRDLILSAILKLIAKEVLPNLEARKDYIMILKKEHKGHAKNRTDEYLALLMLLLEKFLQHIPYYSENDFLYGVESGDKDIRKAWIEYQNAKAKDTETSSNSIIKLLDGLMREYMAKMKDLRSEAHKDYIMCNECGETDIGSQAKLCPKCQTPNISMMEVFVYTHQDYLIEVIKTKPEIHCTECHGLIDSLSAGRKCECKAEQAGDIYSRAVFEFTATSGEVIGAIDRYCKNNGIANPFGNNAAIFAKRLANDERTLKTAGWELVSRPGKEPYWSVIRGNRFYKFRKVMVR